MVRRSPRRQSQQLVRAAIIIIIMVAAVLYARFSDRGTTPASIPAPRQPVAATAAPKQPATITRASTLPAITLAELPPEARATIGLIDQDGPFPFDKDGSTFQNRERRLPGKPAGYYREYTVITPGSDDRGARRIIAGRSGELYYTDDHYDSFWEVLR